MKKHFEFASKLKEAIGMKGKENMTMAFELNWSGQGFSREELEQFLAPDKQIVVYETKNGKDLPPDEKADLEARSRKLLGDRFGGVMSKEEYKQKYLTQN